MTRRELIQKTTMALGYSLSAPVMIGLLNGCKPQHTLTYKPIFFTEDQAAIVSLLADIIIPPTETPGAMKAGVPAFIDAFVKEVFNPEQKEKFIKALEAFNEEAKQSQSKKFLDCSPEQQQSYAKEVHDSAINEAGSVSEGWWNNSSLERPFILKMKELTLLGFFTSEIGATQVLQYNMAPGPYQGCVPLATVGKAWA